MSYFDTNRKGEYYKTCRNSLTRDHKTKHDYYEVNRDAIQQMVNEWTENNREQHLERKKQYREDNKDYILEPLTCLCGGTHTRNGTSRNLRTQKHLKYKLDQALIPNIENPDEKAS